MAEEESCDKAGPIFRDIRRYYCEYCGICRSKKSLIASHIASQHKDKMEAAVAHGMEESQGMKSNTCEECGANFRKPAHLKQHMLSHSLERPYKCPMEDCSASYRRKDHLSRHLLQHQGKIFNCPIDGCSKSFAYQGNVKRHVIEFHSDEQPSTSNECKSQNQHVCPEVGCGKVFEFASKLQTHQNSHVTLETVEAFCSECRRNFSNIDYLKEHMQSMHKFVHCEICGSKQVRKNIKRHLRTHEDSSNDSEEFRCNFEGCCRAFSNTSNLRQHVKAVHLEVKPFGCGYRNCGKTFAYKHVRDHHEKSGCHVYTPGDFQESDEQFQSRPRGGRKRKCPTVDSLLRKRIMPPSELGFLSE